MRAVSMACGGSGDLLRYEPDPSRGPAQGRHSRGHRPWVVRFTGDEVRARRADWRARPTLRRLTRQQRSSQAYSILLTLRPYLRCATVDLC